MSEPTTHPRAFRTCPRCNGAKLSSGVVGEYTRFMRCTQCNGYGVLACYVAPNGLQLYADEHAVVPTLINPADWGLKP